MSDYRDVLQVEVTEVLLQTRIFFGGRGAINRLASNIVDRLFETTDNRETIQEYLNERVYQELPDRR